MRVQWDRPRLWKVRLRGPVDENGKLKVNNYGESIGVVAAGAIRAAEAAIKKFPEYRVESVNDAGGIDIVADIVS